MRIRKTLVTLVAATFGITGLGVEAASATSAHAAPASIHAKAAKKGTAHKRVRRRTVRRRNRRHARTTTTTTR
jgi:hypothetical protein